MSKTSFFALMATVASSGCHPWYAYDFSSMPLYVPDRSIAFKTIENSACANEKTAPTRQVDASGKYPVKTVVAKTKSEYEMLRRMKFSFPVRVVRSLDEVPVDPQFIPSDDRGF